MNLGDIHDSDKMLSAKSIFKSPSSNLTSIQLLAEATLKEHITKIPALLFCISGNVIYEDEKGNNIKLNAGDYFEIKPMIKHWLKAESDSQLLLFK